ncbi:hypothetical protein CLOP_g639 [Closterium sp. NIES-67]|nr:hypothetical protein CLOP_g639 [Closterium sp. NIES-67]
MASLKALYFVPYNACLAVAWLYVLILTVQALATGGPSTVYATAELPLQIAQTAALMEIIHSILGIVRSPVSATLPQIASRLFLVWGVLYPAPQVREHVLVASLLLSWSITEIVRYSFFAVKEAFGSTPAPLLWLRYSMFYVLYPSGITSEVGLAYLALPYLKASHVFSFDMPNKVNFAVDYYLVCILILLTYIPGSPYMYTYMMGQRKKALGKKDKTS